MSSHIRAIVKGNQAMLTLPDGTPEIIVVGEGEDLRGQIVRRSVTAARMLGQGIVLTASGDIGEVELHIASDGSVTVIDESVTVTDAEEPHAIAPEAEAAEQESSEEGVALPDVANTVLLGAPRSGRTIPSTPALRVPVEDEIDRVPRFPVAQLRVWGSSSGECRRQVVGNGQGGVGQSMTTAMLAAACAHERGGEVLAWDNNPARGSLGWRTESSSHDATVQDLLDNAGRLLDPDAQEAMDTFVHHQREDRYDVLRSNPATINADEFALINHVASHHYRHVVFDSGTDESAPWWRRMIDLSHQLIVPTTVSPDSAESGMLLLRELSERDAHSQRLAQDAVVVLTHTQRKVAANTGAVRAGFEEFGATVVEIPFDPALKAVQLRFGSLARQTQDAWIRVAAVAAERF